MVELKLVSVTPSARGFHMSGPELRVAFWVEAVVSGFGTFLGFLTIVWHDWIEGVFGVDPDHGNGAVEFFAVAVLLAIGMVAGALARREWGRVHAMSSSA